jgi:hypothetical protein
MKTSNMIRAIGAMALSSFLFVACTKEDSIQDNLTLSDLSTTLSVPIVSGVNGADDSEDSIIVMNVCERDDSKISIDSASLPATILDYLSSNYAGYTFFRGVKISNSSGTIKGYVAIIYYNDKPVAIRFNADGTFNKVLEQREKEDRHGSGHHRHGRFEHRDGEHRDTIALSALPSTVTDYLAQNHPTDTLLKAFKNSDSSIVVITKNNGLFANLFTSAGVFISRIEIPAGKGEHETIEQSALPISITTYLSSTYPNYVFEKAFVRKENGVIKGYAVIIDANNTKYAVIFDASGNFIKVKTIH